MYRLNKEIWESSSKNECEAVVIIGENERFALCDEMAGRGG